LTRRWRLATRLADWVADDQPERVKNSNAIWEFVARLGAGP
jgi:hypothetical protein